MLWFNGLFALGICISATGQSSFLVSFRILCQGAGKQIEAFLLHGRKRGANGEALPSDSFSSVSISWLIEDFFCYCDPESAVARYRGKVSPFRERDSDAFAASLNYFVHKNGVANWGSARFNVADVKLKHTVLKRKPTKL